MSRLLFMDFKYVQDPQTLEEVCLQAAKQTSIALDTEFVRTRTLTPELGLLQLYDGHQLVLIDPLAIDDMSVLVKLLVNPSVIKVLHSCSEDLEALLTALNVVPTPIFDTQFAASLLGLGQTIGYAKLIQMELHVELEKGESRTDWLARPLSKKQCRYAADDVLYLLPAFEQLYDRVVAAGKLDWVLSESACLSQKKQAVLPSEFVYLQVKNAWRLSSQQLTVLKHLAAWRLKRAQDRNMALNFVFKEPHLYELALRMPQSRSALARIQCLTPHERRINPEILIKIVQTALTEFESTTQEHRIARIKRLIDYPNYKQILSKLKHAATELALYHGVPEEVIASKKQLNQLLKWYWFPVEECKVMNLKPDVLMGWREALFEPIIGSILQEQ